MGWQRRKEKRQEVGRNRARARQRAIEAGPAPDYPTEINRRAHWIKIEITQHSPEGEQIDVVTAYMAHNRVDSWNVKHGSKMLFRENEHGLLRLGNHRLMAWIAKNILQRYGNLT